MSGFYRNGVDIVQSVVGPPVGSIMTYAGNTDPSGWLICDGRSVTISSCANLFSVIGTTYGGNGAPYFNIPDLTNAFIRGRSVITTITKETGGASSVTLSTANMPSHNHTASDSGHQHGLAGSAMIHCSGAFGYDSNTSNGLGSFYMKKAETNETITALNDKNVQSGNANITVNYTGSSAPFSILPSYVAMNYIIRY